MTPWLFLLLLLLCGCAVGVVVGRNFITISVRARVYANSVYGVIASLKSFSWGLVFISVIWFGLVYCGGVEIVGFHTTIFMSAVKFRCNGLMRVKGCLLKSNDRYVILCESRFSDWFFFINKINCIIKEQWKFREWVWNAYYIMYFKTVMKWL